MPPCCSCGTRGRCQNCSCVKNGRSCSNCQPNRLRKCENQEAVPRASESCPTPLAAETADEESPAALDSLLNDPTRSNPDSSYDLPPFIPLNRPNFHWSESVDGWTFTDLVNKAYQEVLHWRHNIFSVPSGKAGTAFISELSRLFRGIWRIERTRSNNTQSCHDPCPTSPPAASLQSPSQGSYPLSRKEIDALEQRQHLRAFARRENHPAETDLSFLFKKEGQSCESIWQTNEKR